MKSNLVTILPINELPSIVIYLMNGVDGVKNDIFGMQGFVDIHRKNKKGLGFCVGDGVDAITGKVILFIGLGNPDRP